ncbi:uncharacterized protein LOC121880752 [Thunnus maccoyii]|uniref:uncharacterized protein LOC121880752 n=1 Tax=Thunnus maccoyii TaxID=8240 RepID=UPI001C4DBBE0|nr:uncharacterized protein LOC121880752 [Thunnus maccoyii]XP_042244191.1 uncharacterized protein LOC121880752 [Thunnus maccoyii]XP_042244199.1 uncharacterized protein LOC121880752 [Thunnus maccoyii]
MLLAEAFCVFVGFILCISGVQGRANSICALKGSSVDLPCSAQHPTSSMKWFTVHQNGSEYVLNELSADGNRVTYNMSEESNYTLMIKDLRESDEKSYCCSKTTETPELCWHNRTELYVSDLQVKVIPATESETVSLICKTSCPPTENPAAYIWYKNREFLYQDWSPWYRQLVSGEEAVRYSCAIKGYEDLRAPEVSVDSVTSTCFTVTYAEGRMCPYNETSVDEPCSITYPREVHVEKTQEKKYLTLTCATSCPTVDPHTAYKLFMARKLLNHCNKQNIMIFGSSYVSFSCAIEGNEDLRSAEFCIKDKGCMQWNYVSGRICALEGSSVNISVEYSGIRQDSSKLWNKTEIGGYKDAESEINNTGRVKYDDSMENHHILTIDNLQKSDSGEYTFRVKNYKEPKDLPRVTLVVTGLRVRFNPSAEVTEGQRVTLTCSTSCPLTDNTTYIWYLNSQPLPENQNKQLVLDPVSIQHAGNYSCTVETPQNISSSEETLTVARRKSVARIMTVKLTTLSLSLSAVVLLYLWMRKKKTQTSAGELHDKTQTEEMESFYASISPRVMNPAAQREPAEEQEDTL